MGLPQLFVTMAQRPAQVWAADSGWHGGIVLAGLVQRLPSLSPEQH
jgi:hypothetical protein